PLETPSFPLKGVDAQASAADERAATSFQAGAMAFAVAPAPVLAVQGMARAQAWGGNPHAWMARKGCPCNVKRGQPLLYMYDGRGAGHCRLIHIEHIQLLGESGLPARTEAL